MDPIKDNFNNEENLDPELWENETTDPVTEEAKDAEEADALQEMFKNIAEGEGIVSEEKPSDEDDEEEWVLSSKSSEKKSAPKPAAAPKTVKKKKPRRLRKSKKNDQGERFSEPAIMDFLNYPDEDADDDDDDLFDDDLDEFDDEEEEENKEEFITYVDPISGTVSRESTQNAEAYPEDVIENKDAQSEEDDSPLYDVFSVFLDKFDNGAPKPADTEEVEDGSFSFVLNPPPAAPAPTDKETEVTTDTVEVKAEDTVKETTEEISNDLSFEDDFEIEDPEAAEVTDEATEVTDEATEYVPEEAAPETAETPEEDILPEIEVGDIFDNKPEEDAEEDELLSRRKDDDGPEEDEEEDEFFRAIENAVSIGAEEKVSAPDPETERIAAEDAARRAAEEKEKQTIKEMRRAVEDIMFNGETPEEREERHRKEDELDALPMIDFNGIDFSAVPDDDYPDGPTRIAKPRRKKKWPWVLLGIFGFIVLFALFILFTRPGHAIASRLAARFIFSKVTDVGDDMSERLNEEDVLGQDHQGEFLHPVTNTPTPTPEPTQVVVVTGEPVPTDTSTPTPTPVEKYHPHYAEDHSVINILLIGVENHDNLKYGRSDSMMIASMDKDGGDLKLVSLMRDMYVEIPGYSDNRLNAAFAFGGPELLLETIELNFGVVCDGYAMVDYEGFEKIIDYIGGLEISLTAEEAHYLNTTNYISDKKQRHVVEGLQTMTGNQVVGYCRIRHVQTANGLGTDFGRTYRQRVVMNKIFEKYKNSSVSTLYNAMNDCLPYITCPSSLEKLAADCLQIIVEKRMFNLATYRIPVSGEYEETRVGGEIVDGQVVGGQQVIVWYDTNPDLLHKILYGEN